MVGYNVWCLTAESTAWTMNACKASWLITRCILNAGIGLLFVSGISSNIGAAAGLGDSSDSSCDIADRYAESSCDISD